MPDQPSIYDLFQDGRLDALEGIVSPDYVPPEGTEMSFPVVGQGVDSQQFRQMSLAQGSGVLITDDSEYPYVLQELPGGASETNARNQMVLKVAQHTGRAEAIIAGFYHVLHEDMIIDLPPVTTPTTYYICLTYDPRREEEPEGPIRVEVHTNSLPRTYGRKHVVLHTVHREPNQLLTQATINLRRQYISPTITVVSESALPDPTDVQYGTLAVVRSRTSGGKVVPGTGKIFEARGIHGWHELLGADWQAAVNSLDTSLRNQITQLRNDFSFGSWRSCRVFDNQGWSGSAYVRRRPGGMDLRFNIRNQAGSGAQEIAQISLPADLAIGSTIFYGVVMTTSGPFNYRVGHAGNGRHAGLQGGSSRPTWTRGNLFVPDWYLANP